MTWNSLANIETDSGNPAAAGAARAKAIASYLAYRRDGGENHNESGRLVVKVIEALRAEGPGAALSVLRQQLTAPEFTYLAPFTRALEAVVAGSRDRAIADDPNLDYVMAAEILFLIETLGRC